MFGNKIKLSMTHDEIRVLVYALNELRNALRLRVFKRLLDSYI